MPPYESNSNPIRPLEIETKTGSSPDYARRTSNLSTLLMSKPSKSPGSPKPSLLPFANTRKLMGSSAPVVTFLGTVQARAISRSIIPA